MFAVNALNFPPFAGCGAGPDQPYGCGRLSIDGTHVDASTTRWAAYEAGRRSSPLPGSGVAVSTATRMPFEQAGVMWKLDFANPGTEDVW